MNKPKQHIPSSFVSLWPTSEFYSMCKRTVTLVPDKVVPTASDPTGATCLNCIKVVRAEAMRLACEQNKLIIECEGLIRENAKKKKRRSI